MSVRQDLQQIGAIGAFALAKLVFHTVVNRGYGFHRDELATLDDARHLAFGYVAYPPFTPFLGRIELMLFGESLAGFRFFAALAQSIAIVLAALIAKRLGGDRRAQWLAALAVAISPISLSASSLFQYVSFDYLWWVVIALLVVRLVETDDGRWWLAIGAAIGLGFLTKYTILFLVAGLLAGIVLTPLRRHLGTIWPWAGAAGALLVAAPNIVWQIQHDFISLDMLRTIHERDVRIGRTNDFLLNQLFVPANVVTIPLWIAGLVALFRSRFRILGWMAVVPFLLFLVARGRDYYTAPIYPTLFAAGSLWLARRKIVFVTAVVIFLLSGALMAALILPMAPAGTQWWRRALETNNDLREEIGWPEMVAEVARIWNTLPPAERRTTAIYCANYGEAGAVNLYGPKHGLPQAISGVNSFWARGYGNPPPETVIVLGGRPERLAERFESVVLAGRVPNPLRVENEEAEHPDIYLCRKPRRGWEEVWPTLRRFG